MAELPMIQAEGLYKRYGTTQAVDGVSLSVPRGTILGVLGPNGAGKTTTVRMLTTMTKPDKGSVHVAGVDVVADPRAARRRIGVTGQDATLDELLTGRQNLMMIGQLSKLPRADAAARATTLLAEFDLTDAGDRLAKGYSGGMRRRLDLAASLVSRPEVLFLDEPTTGLDPTSRVRMWDVIRNLVADGTTLLLTTQYLDEADELADAISVIDHGKVIAHGTAKELKATVGGEQLELTLSAPSELAVGALSALVTGAITTSDDGRTMRASVSPGAGKATAIIRALDDAGVAVDDVQFHHPSLDDVFFALTGNPAEAPADPESDPELSEQVA
ncbi:ATP-binding cassette domain-containing protein [Aquihabitans sp. McL0605]|uniref:ATP-binding cassette domain-containing protein n=1 Tax=Aquihabitans sp. McL0605 TaxID=3415671 RepID=UPI003CF48FAA